MSISTRLVIPAILATAAGSLLGGCTWLQRDADHGGATDSLALTAPLATAEDMTIARGADVGTALVATFVPVAAPKTTRECANRLRRQMPWSAASAFDRCAGSTEANWFSASVSNPSNDDATLICDVVAFDDAGARLFAGRLFLGLDYLGNIVVPARGVRSFEWFITPIRNDRVEVEAPASVARYSATCQRNLNPPI